MKEFLNHIRSAENPISGNRKIINTIAVLFLGIAFRDFFKVLRFSSSGTSKCAYGNRWSIRCP